MFRTLVKTDALAIEDTTLTVRYFELRTRCAARCGTAPRSCSRPATASSSTTTR